MESALVEHKAVAEAAVVGRPHPVKGESLYCFVTLTEGVTYGRTLEAELKRLGLIPILEPVPLASPEGRLLLRASQTDHHGTLGVVFSWCPRCFM